MLEVDWNYDLACWHGWHATFIVIVIIEILSWRKTDEFFFWNKNEKSFQIYFNSDLKEETELKSRFFYIIWSVSADKIFGTNSNFHVK